MGQKKLIRFAALKTFANTLEYPENMKGQWRAFFKNDNPVVLELACGRGEYTVGLAKLYPEKNFIGVDVKGNRMYIGAKQCLQENLSNAAFLRTQISLIHNYFDKNEVDEIWFTFPDPQLRTSKARKRLTHPEFLRLYQQFLKPGGLLHLKTDSPRLYHFTLRVTALYKLPLMEANDNVYTRNASPELSIKTYYESLNIAGSNRIFYTCFKLPESIPNLDKELQEELRQTEETGIESNTGAAS
ncbi:MAG: tRNA (guanosine(46)-N7)-methyltransferase TrmB [Ferruginibacter sp.]